MTQDLYYLRDTRNLADGKPLYWRKSGGYTTNPNEAEVFTKETADYQHASRESDVPVLCSEVDKNYEPVAGMKHIGWVIFDKEGNTFLFKEKFYPFYGTTMERLEIEVHEIVKIYERDWAGLAPFTVKKAYA